jgi:UDP-N-acetylglucosamine diphosphorylase/glucosamine-1-phosphate N-acetyltransferase
MTAHLLLFEDPGWPDLGPLTELLPVQALAFGDSDLTTRWRRAVPKSRLIGLEARPLALAAWRDAPAAEEPSAGSAEALAVNAAALPGPWLEAALAGPPGVAWIAGDRLVGARLPLARLAEGRGRGPGFESFLRHLALPATTVEARVLRWPWDLVEWNLEALAGDLERARPLREGEIHKLAAIEEPSRVVVERGARVDAHAVLDARMGPIRLAKGSVVLSHTLMQGPCSVGPGTELLGGTIGRSTFGPGCRVAGEVDASVWQGWANKRHHGFVGHSAIGEWVNLGALTTTSDLKNTYGLVRAWVGGREVDTGLHKVGATLGAHAKTGIGTLLPTGAVIGTGSNLFGGGRFAPKHVPAFTWWGGETAEEHRLERFLETARLAMSRRERPLREAEEAALRALFAATEEQRSARVGAG